jgi:hypothetical protein
MWPTRRAAYISSPAFVTSPTLNSIPLGVLVSCLGRTENTITASSKSSPTLSLIGQFRRRMDGKPGGGHLVWTVNAARAVDLARGGASLLDVRENREWKGRACTGPSTSP